MRACTAPNRLLTPARDNTVSLTGASVRNSCGHQEIPAALHASAYSAVQMSSTL